MLKEEGRNTSVTCSKWTAPNVGENTHSRDVKVVDRFDLVLRGHLENVGLLLTQELLAPLAKDKLEQASR